MVVLDFGTAALVFGGFGLVLAYLAREIDQWPKRLCVAIFITAMASVVADMLVNAAPQYQVPVPLYRVLMVFQAIVAPLPTLLVVAYILFCCGEDYRKSTPLRVLCVLSGLMAVGVSLMEIFAEIGPPPDYTPQFGLWPVLFFFLSTALLTVTLIVLLRRWKKLTVAQRVMFLLSFFSSRASVIIFVEFLLVYDLIRRYLAQQKESEQQRTRLAVAQMRPHFIYNTLLSIYYLCAEDTEKTQRVILDFIKYLRNNFTAIGEEKPILFEKELEHTRAYLAVEQACYEGHLFVEFDTPVTYFRVPALTLQPIVENAVKHGLGPGLPSLYVSVATENVGNGTRITVEDTGPGFQQAMDNEPHLALDNIRRRLKAMCDGTLEVEPREQGGTKVTIWVPLKNGEDRSSAS